MLFVTNPLLAQGIEFTKGTLQEVFNMARQQNKLIFVDSLPPLFSFG